ncbi:hypothetical protein [Paenibacillus jiagnxiensis]|uniref:hypothetical protein n=1 Tax=Paenibacillus jiagnxiensis TaxID=3228926 RepID=UPI00339EB7F6
MNEEILTQILGKLESIDNRMDSFETRMDSLETNMVRMTERLDSLETKVDRIENKLDKTFEQVASHTETIHEIVATQERHERILGELSVRSIEQEAYMRQDK